MTLVGGLPTAVQKGVLMRYVLAAVLFVLWLPGPPTWNAAEGIAHILLIVAIFLFAFNLADSRGARRHGP